MFISKEERDSVMEILKEKVQSLQTLFDAAVKYNSMNKDMIKYDLEKAQAELAKFKGN